MNWNRERELKKCLRKNKKKSKDKFIWKNKERKNLFKKKNKGENNKKNFNSKLIRYWLSSRDKSRRGNKN